MRIMCLDMGTKTIGIAVSDELGITAQPLKTLSRKTEEEDIDALKRLISELNVTEVVVGLPKKTDGSLGPAAVLVLEFAEKLKSAIPQPIHTWDGRFSTVAVTRTLLAGDASRARRKKVVNRLAAAYILQGFLDSR